MDYKHLTKISQVLRNGVDVMDFADSMSPTQYESKKWLVDTLQQYYTKQQQSFLIMGSWYGSYLVPMIKECWNPSSITLNDINPKVLSVARSLHGNSCSYEVFDAARDKERVNKIGPDVIVNTSCEHMDDMSMFVPSKRTLFVLQTCNNENDPGHINTSKTTEEFVQKSGLHEVIYRGRLDLGHKSRFMVIGWK